jgi:hypothetical protein
MARARGVAHVWSERAASAYVLRPLNALNRTTTRTINKMVPNPMYMRPPLLDG